MDDVILNLLWIVGTNEWNKCAYVIIVWHSKRNHCHHTPSNQFKIVRNVVVERKKWTLLRVYIISAWKILSFSQRINWLYTSWTIYYDHWIFMVAHQIQWFVSCFADVYCAVECWKPHQYLYFFCVFGKRTIAQFLIHQRIQSIHGSGNWWLMTFNFLSFHWISCESRACIKSNSFGTLFKRGNSLSMHSWNAFEITESNYY